MKILAVDDDNAVRISLNVMFRKWNDIELDVAEDANNDIIEIEIEMNLQCQTQIHTMT